MWPFKKKLGLLDAAWLRSQGISSDFVDAFRYSTRELKGHIVVLEQQEKMWNTQLSDLHNEKNMRRKKMDRLQEKAADQGISEVTEFDILAQLKELNKQSVQDSKRTREAMASLREVEKTSWLLKHILDGTFANPSLVSAPPQEGWLGDWEDLFDSIPDAGGLTPETKDELREMFAIKKNKADTKVEDPVVEDDLDPTV